MKFSERPYPVLGRAVFARRWTYENLFGGWIRSRDTVGEVQNSAQTTPVGNYRGSEEAVLHEQFLPQRLHRMRSVHPR
jgi:hypothetical protein